MQHATGAGRSESGLTAARAALAEPLELEALLTHLGAKDRSSVEKHLSVVEGGPDAPRADLWRRLARALITLAPHAAKASQQAVQFFIPDGRYRMQVFALHDPGDGTLVIYCENVLDKALAAKLLLRPKPSAGGAQLYRLAHSEELLSIETLDGKTENLPPFCSNMTGWNRRALRIILPVRASEAQIQAAELLCALAAQSWPGA